MSPPNDSLPPEHAGTRQLLSGERDALTAIDTVIARAQQSLMVFDHELKGRGYNSPTRYEVLRRFLLAGRQNTIRIALHEIRGLETDCPRLLMLKQQFPSAIRIHRTVGVARSAQDPLLIADDHSYWHRLHYQHPRSVLLLDTPIDARPLMERFEEIWESSEAAAVGSALGL